MTVTAEAPAPAKPVYRVPSMGEVRAVPWNGYRAASTFSGCGGSSLGYRMAGYRVVWANEFVEAARETYAANAAPYTVIDDRDIRAVRPQDFFDATGIGEGQLDLLDGSPPCSSFSTAGKRHKGWGHESAYSDTAQRTDDLFFEFVRLLTGIRPRVFVAENVSGLVKGTAKGYFKEILAGMKAAGYVVSARLLDAQWLGVPQARQRIIFVGVRQDLAAQYGVAPVHPSPLPYRYSVREALPWILEQGDNGGFGAGSMRSAASPSPTIGSGPATGNGRFPPSIVRVVHDNEGSRSSSGDVTDLPLPPVTVGTQTAGRRAYRVVHDTSGDRSAGDVTDRPAPAVTVGVGSINSLHFRAEDAGRTTHDPETGQPLTINGRTVPAGTTQRKLTLTELRALCGFPDDFVLTGTYAQRWERLGRAVPPPMMERVAATIRDEILGRLPCAD